MEEISLFKKIFGCLVGGAIGDAFGIRVEMMHYLDIKEQYGWVTHFEDIPWRKESTQSPLERWNPFGVQMGDVDGFHPLGRWSHEVGGYTDDMRYRLLACHAMLQKGGPINGMDFAQTWFNYRLMAEGADEYEPTLSWPGPQKAYARAMSSLERLSHLANQTRPCFSGWDAPMGIIHAGNPAAAAESGYAMSVAIATALTPDATIDEVIENVLEYAWVLGHHAGEFTGRLERVLKIARGCATPFDLYEPFYKEFLVTFPPWEAVWTMEMIPAALAICSIAGEDTQQVIIGATNIGRDADTIAGIAGELVGALYGIDALPQEWVEKVLRLNPIPDMEKMAKDLTNLIIERNQSQLGISNKLLSELKE
jgi:ADP-ribosylglycohydrolase